MIVIVIDRLFRAVVVEWSVSGRRRIWIGRLVWCWLGGLVGLVATEELVRVSVELGLAAAREQSYKQEQQGGGASGGHLQSPFRMEGGVIRVSHSP
jgi:hypothetical protein